MTGTNYDGTLRHVLIRSGDRGIKRRSAAPHQHTSGNRCAGGVRLDRIDLIWMDQEGGVIDLFISFAELVQNGTSFHLANPSEIRPSVGVSKSAWRPYEAGVSD